MDGALRRWERALAGGDEQVRVPLAAAYQRLGRSDEALGILSVGLRGDPSANALRQATWRSILSRLAPARRIEGARGYGELWGWAGARAVLLGSRPERRPAGLFAVADWTRGELAYEAPSTRPPPPAPVGGSPSSLLLATGPGVLQRLFFDARPPVELRVAVGGRALDLDPSHRQALVRYLEPNRRVVLSVVELPAENAGGSGGEVFQATGSAELRALPNWETGWIAWSDVDQPLRWAELAADASPRALAGPRTRLRPLATLGRFLLARGARGLILLDPRSEERRELSALEPQETLPSGSAQSAHSAHSAHSPPIPRTQVHGPWRLTSDEQHLLAFRLGLPVALPLAGGLPRALSLPGGPALTRAVWHPQADLVACGRRGEGAELRELSGEVWLRLPRDAQALGWSPGGRSLVVLRQLGSVGGLLELWTPGGTLGDQLP